MYPWFRLFKEVWKSRKAPKLGLLGTHVSHHICWPQDIDPWKELNNGRTLTLYDLGRIPLAIRAGFAPAAKAQGWGLTVAGTSIRYRRRVRLFDRVEMRSRCIGWDERFLYMDQSMWKAGECTSQALLRTAVTSKTGIVNPARVAEALGHQGPAPELPGWVRAWVAADAERPWPPMRGD